MRYGIFGDIHSNLEAFQKVIEGYKKEHIDRYICVGDIVGYGADPHKCIDLLKGLDIKSVCGNHDRASVGLFDVNNFNKAAREAVLWTKERLSEEENFFLKSLELVITEEDFLIVHGSLDGPDFFNYILDIESAVKSFQRMEGNLLYGNSKNPPKHIYYEASSLAKADNLCFVGHSHIPVIFFMSNKEVRCVFEDCIKIEQGVKYIINVGSVGQPRDGNPKACFCIYDSDTKIVEIKRVDYDIEIAKDKILRAGLPAILGYRLLEGR